MDFAMERVKQLYKTYYRLYILTDEKKYNTHVDIEQDELIKLYHVITERMTMEGFDVDLLEV